MAALDDFRADARRWLDRLAERHPLAIVRLKRAYPDAGEPPALEDVQHALAREEGYDDWAALERDIARIAPGWWRVGPLENDATRLAKFLDFACWDHRTHGRIHFAARQAAAVAMLRKRPALARHDLYTAVVCGELDEVRRMLDEQPGLVNRKGGARRWEPLLYLTYARLPAGAVPRSAADMATLLLDRGANPDPYYMAGDAFYSALVGLPGEGEQDAPPHPERDALYALLLERGANPFDIQVLYNTHFSGNVLWWLQLTYAHTMRTSHRHAWEDPNWPMFDMGGYGCGARFLFWLAIRKNDVALTRWLLEHGANPNAPPAPNPHWPAATLYEEALRAGRDAIARLLHAAGAPAAVAALGDEDLYVSAALRLDRAGLDALLRKHPDYGQSSKALFAAARVDHAAAVAMLLDAGTPVDVRDEHAQTALHVAGAANACRAAAVLLARGADANLREQQWNATPLGYAVHHGHGAMIDLLVPASTDVWNLAYGGHIGRLRDVLAAVPTRARDTSADGLTPLFWLPSDDAQAVQAVDLLLANGADPRRRSPEGRSAEDIARERGLDAAAERLAAAARDPV